MKIYNISPTLPDTPAWERAHWGPNNGWLLEEGPDGKPQHNEDFDQIIADVPQDMALGINLERSSGTWEYLNYDLHPQDSVRIREELVDRINFLRPDLKLFLYLMPDHVGQATRDPQRWLSYIAERELANRGVTTGLTWGSTTGYWKNDFTESGWVNWKRRQDLALSLIDTVHIKQPIAFIWDRMDQWRDPMPYWAFNKVLRYYEDRDVTVAFWSPYAYPRPIRWEAQMLLWKYSQA